MNHRSTVFNFNGCQVNYNQDSGGVAFMIGKNLAGTLNCNGTTSVTWASGSTFGTFDNGDALSIGGTTYFVSSVSSGTSMTLQSSCSAGAGAIYASTSMGTTGGTGNYSSPITIRDLVLGYSGANTQNNTAMEFQFVTHPQIENVTIYNFTSGTGMYHYGTLDGVFINTKVVQTKYGIILDQATRASVTISSNLNTFIGTTLLAITTNPLLIQNNSFDNQFIGFNAEGNTATCAVSVQSGAANNRWFTADMEVNGDNTTSSCDFLFNGPRNQVTNYTGFGGTNTPANGVKIGTSATETVIRDSSLVISGGAYGQYGWTITGGGTASIQNVDTGGAATNGMPLSNLDAAGNGTFTGNLTVGGYGLFSGNVTVKSGANVIYRCTVAGTLRIGQLTSVSGDCGTAVDTGLRTP